VVYHPWLQEDLEELDRHALRRGTLAKPRWKRAAFVMFISTLVFLGYWEPGELFFFTKQVLPVRGPYSLQYRMAGCMPWPDVFLHLPPKMISPDVLAGSFSCVLSFRTFVSRTLFRKTCLLGCLGPRGLLVKKKGPDRCGCLGQTIWPRVLC